VGGRSHARETAHEPEARGKRGGGLILGEYFTLGGNAPPRGQREKMVKKRKGALQHRLTGFIFNKRRKKERRKQEA